MSLVVLKSRSGEKVEVSGRLIRGLAYVCPKKHIFPHVHELNTGVQLWSGPMEEESGGRPRWAPFVRAGCLTERHYIAQLMFIWTHSRWPTDFIDWIASSMGGNGHFPKTKSVDSIWGNHNVFPFGRVWGKSVGVPSDMVGKRLICLEHSGRRPQYFHNWSRMKVMCDWIKQTVIGDTDDRRADLGLFPYVHDNRGRTSNGMVRQSGDGTQAHEGDGQG